MASATSSSATMQRPRVISITASTPQLPTTSAIVIETGHIRETRSGEGHKMINQYEMKLLLGKGQHGEVWKSKDTLTNEIVAIKAMKRKNPKQDRMSLLRRSRLPRSPQHLSVANNLGATEIKILKEIAIMKKLRHPNVVRLMEVLNDNLKERIYMVMEFMAGGEIKWRTDDEEPLLRVSQTRRICRDVLLGLEYLHDQGIIHRDIKPANLLWSADRRVVKIADFGISHFSYAQFLAAKGKTADSADIQDLEGHDKILLDESDLTRFAGTPTFLAPEIISDGSADMSASASTSGNLESTSVEVRRPVISKAIDIWAFGVTLYALLFGKLPFLSEGEYQIYNKIKEEDWDVPETMGQDMIPVGGRRQNKPKKSQETEGYLVVDLLQGILEKDPAKRLDLQDIKRHPWITRDMPNAEQWLRATNGAENVSLAPTEDETSSALSTVFFRYKFRNRLARGISSGISSIFRNIRPQRSFRANTGRSAQPLSEEEQRYRRIGTRSMPHVELSQPQSATGANDKGKQPMKSHAGRNKSSVDVRTSQQTKSLDWASSSAGGSNVPDVGGSGIKPRRGSAPGLALSTLDTLRVPARSSRVSSPQRSPSVQSPSTPHMSELTQEDRPRSRLSLLVRWMINKPASWAPSQQASTSTLPSGAVSPSSIASGSRPTHTRDLTQRRSEDAFNRVSSHNDGSLTQAMRAASWGEVDGYRSRPSEDMASLYSDHGEDGPDEDTYLVGFGGVAQSPVSTVPSAVLSTVSSLGSLGSAVPMSAAQILLQRAEGSGSADLSSVPDLAARDAVLVRHAQVRAHATSPLSHRASEEDLDPQSPTFEDSDGESDVTGDRTPSEQDFAPNTSVMYQEADEESDEEEPAPLEVKTRRPSWSVHSRPSSPRRSDIGQEGCARPAIRI